jgi:hypothetical protein
MVNLTRKKYFLVGNLTFTPDSLVKLPKQDMDYIKVNLPIGFKQVQGKKYIKLYGYTLTYPAHYRNRADEELSEQTYAHMQLLRPPTIASCICSTTCMLVRTRGK